MVLFVLGLTFLGNVKTASKEFPVKYLGDEVLAERGARVVLASINEETGKTELVALTWLDRNRRNFVATAYGLGEGEEIVRTRFRQIDDDPEADPDKVLIEVKQPLAVDRYYNGAGIIDHRNKLRQGELRVDKNIRTVDWSVRANLAIWGIDVCDAYALFQQTVRADNRASCPKEFFCKLADQLIDNKEGVRVTRSQVSEESSEEARPHLRKTLRYKKCGKRHDQGKCRNPSCNSQPSYVCSACTDPTDKNKK